MAEPKKGGSPVAKLQGLSTLQEALETVESEAKPRRVWKGRLTEEEHFALDQLIRSLLAEHKRIDEIMEETGLSKAAVYRHLGHIREEYRKWAKEQWSDGFLSMLMASVESLQNQARYLIAAEKEATTVGEKVRLALAVKEVELASASLIGDDPESCGLRQCGSILNPVKPKSYVDIVMESLK